MAVGVEPRAVCEHDYEFDKGPSKWRYLERNRWATVICTYPGRLLGPLAPGLLATELALHVVALVGGWLMPKLRADADVLGALPRLRRERRAIQATTRADASGSPPPSWPASGGRPPRGCSAPPSTGTGDSS